MTERYGCCGSNGFIWNGMRKRDMREDIEVAEPTKTGQLLVLLVIISDKTC